MRRNKADIMFDLEAILNLKEGKIITKINNIINTKTKFTIQCKNNHQWISTINTLNQGSWCKVCFNESQKIKFEEIIDFAKNKNGECVSNTNEYKNFNSKLKWKCHNNHEWLASFCEAKNNNRWCQICIPVRNNKKSTIKEMQDMAKEKNGECLSKTYINAGGKLKWKCIDGHMWEASGSSIKQGTWCPHCKIHTGQKICQIIFEILFENKFTSIRPDWLKNEETGKNLELDGYCSELNMAFEYQGQQHYKKTFEFHTEDDLKRTQKHDAIKKQICKKLNIKLIIINEIKKFTIQGTIDMILNEILSLYHINIDLINKITKSFIEPYIYTSNFEKYKKIAIEKDGKCLSKFYINTNEKLIWQCKDGHIWEAKPSSIQSGQWCEECWHNETKNNSLNKCKNYAASRGGECISITHEPNTKLTWKCEHNHIWIALIQIKDLNEWCPVCSKNKQHESTLNKCKDYAKTKNGECLSNKYIPGEKLTWSCKDGHIWDASQLIKNVDAWCPECNGTKKLTICDARDIAKLNNGQCLSEEYVNIRSTLKWQCSELHTWKMSLEKIKHHNQWCPECKK